MQQIVEHHYLVAILEEIIVACEVQAGSYPQFALVYIPYQDGEQLYAANCSLMNVPTNMPAPVQMLHLNRFARLLAQRGDTAPYPESWGQYENVCALYQYDPDPGPKPIQSFAEFRRPQDFATRGLAGDDAPPWLYRRILYIVTQDTMAENMRLRASTSYIVNAYADIALNDRDMMQSFSGVFPMMSMRGADDEQYPPPMKPTDCLGEDDFWDVRLGAPPLPCGAEDEDAESRIRAGLEDLSNGDVHRLNSADELFAGEPDDERVPDFGACCVCGKEDTTVRNVLMLPFCAPVLGTGWGCFTCGLPNDGAVAVVCDACLESVNDGEDSDDAINLKEVCHGFASSRERAPYSVLTEPFGHVEGKHLEHAAPLN